MVPVQKSNGKLRICVDLRKLNSAVTRARFVLPTLEDVAPNLAGAQYFSKLDASSGFWQIPLHPESAKLTTFITRSGDSGLRDCHLESLVPQRFSRV